MNLEQERDRFEQAALEHFVNQRNAGAQIADDNGSPATREALFWRDCAGNYGVKMFNAAWWGWKVGVEQAAEKKQASLADYDSTNCGERDSLPSRLQSYVDRGGIPFVLSEDLKRAIQTIEALRAQVVGGELGEIIGCFDAAIAEGLYEAIAETTDERLKDLLERRVMHAYYKAVGPSRQAEPAPSTPNNCNLTECKGMPRCQRCEAAAPGTAVEREALAEFALECSRKPNSIGDKLLFTRIAALLQAKTGGAK